MARSDAFGWPQRLRFRNRARSRTRLAPAKHSRPARQLAPKRLVRPARGCSPAASQAKASKGDGHARPDTRSEFLHASRSEEHTSELQSLMRISYAVFCLKKKTSNDNSNNEIPKHITNNEQQQTT